MKVRKHSRVPRLLGAFLASGALTLSAALAGNAAAHPGHDHGGSDSGNSGSSESSAKSGGANTRGGAGAGTATGGGSGSKAMCTDTGVPTTAACNGRGR
ncbi:hypothetical protein ACQ856_25590 [Mycolicibacterium psychrotolerans]|uniref:hypothetical protein n=1 Tax=Mycolicibacterium psychrotolerans TaxID=216929 RepID=UPI003D668BD5